MKHFDLFSGYGGFSLACEKNEIETVGFSEIDKYASAVLKYHWENIKNYGDITKINWYEVPDFDLLTGGSPCQDFSIAGKRKGIAGERSGLVWEFIRCLEEKKPRYFIWENVKGVMSSRRGLDFANILTAFSESGYSLWWQVLNAKDFGVPQNRERIFVVGFRDGSPREIFFEREDSPTHNVIPTLTTRYYGGQANGAYIGDQKNKIKQLNNPTHSNNRLYSEDGISPALNTAQGGNRQPKIARQPLKFLGRNQKNIDGDYSFTVDTANTGGIKIDSRIRRLTPVECERLMGLPDNWTSAGGTISDSQRYKMCGNGVVVNVVEELIKNLV